MNWTFSLSEDEKKMLQKYLKFYRSLDEGTRKPTTEAQKHFKAVCEGKKAPTTDHERLYVTFVDKKYEFLEFQKNIETSHTSLTITPNNSHSKNSDLSKHEEKKRSSYWSDSALKTLGNRALNPSNRPYREKGRVKKVNNNVQKVVTTNEDQHKLERINLGRANLRLRNIYNAMAANSD